MATRDLPHSFKEAFLGWYPRVQAEVTLGKAGHAPAKISDNSDAGELESEENEEQKLTVKKLWPIFTAGAGLFSDGYVNNSIGTASTCLSLLYPDEYAKSNAISNVASIAFVGTVVGQLVFGYVADYHSRKIGMIVSTVILIIFTILCSGSWGAGGSVGGMLAALTAYRFFLGIGIGGEYPAGSVACAEASALLPPGKRNRYFIWFTNFMIDFGFVVSAFVPYVVLCIFRTTRLEWVWRLPLGLGALPPLSLFFMRLKFKEGDQFKKVNFKRTRVPYWLVIKYYWFRLSVVSIIWFIYDFSVYAFGLYSSAFLSVIVPGNDLYKTFGWNVVINLFYIPGSFLGALGSDYFGPRVCLVVGLSLQAIIGYIMAGCYDALKKHVAAFVVVYGIFLSLGEFGPGDSMGLLASKTSATSIRGQYYGIAAAVGKIGAFVGTYVFPVIQKNAGGADTTKGAQAPFWVASSLALFSAFLGLFFLPPVDQDAIVKEDDQFLEYLEASGFNMALLGDVREVEEVVNESLSDEKGAK